MVRGVRWRPGTGAGVWGRLRRPLRAARGPGVGTLNTNIPDADGHSCGMDPDEASFGNAAIQISDECISDIRAEQTNWEKV